MKSRRAGLWSVLPTASRARTWNVCAPAGRTGAVKGVAHAAYSAVSSRHWNVALTSGDVKVKAGVLSSVAPEGPPVIVVCGASVSTTKLLLAGVGSGSPTASSARTSKVCAPFAREDVVYGVTQPVNAPASTRHWNVAAASEEVNVKVETWELVSPDGPLVMTVSAISATWHRDGGGGPGRRGDGGGCATGLGRPRGRGWCCVHQADREGGGEHRHPAESARSHGVPPTRHEGVRSCSVRMPCTLSVPSSPRQVAREVPPDEVTRAARVHGPGRPG